MVVYLAIIALILLLPYTARWTPNLPDWFWPSAILIGAVGLTVARGGSVAMISLFLLPPLIGLGFRSFFGGVAAMLLFAPVIWWTRDIQLSPTLTGIFTVVALTTAFLPRLLDKTNDASPGNALPMILCFGVGMLCGLMTGAFGAREPLSTAWHHWGAYISPAEAWLSGGLPYRDFPVQYGLGPTSLIAATCGNDCWRGIYRITIVANALYFATLAGCVIILTASLRRGLRWLAVLALFCACFLWTAAPVNLSTPIATPSVAGLRFLAITALVLHILFAEHTNRPRDWIGHLIWVVDLFWSPESAFFGTLIWWPYLALRDAKDITEPRALLMTLLRGALRAGAALVLGLVVLAVVASHLSGGSLTPDAFLTYILHPPGRLPVNPLGPVWLGLASIILATHVMVRHGRSAQARNLYACLLALAAAASYFLSRSHDNNVLNLFPFLIIVLLAALAAAPPDDAAKPTFLIGFAQTTFAAMIAFVAAFNFWPWIKAYEAHALFQIGPAPIIARFSPRHGDPEPFLTPDAVNGLQYLRDRRAGSVVMLSYVAVMPSAPPGTGWTGVNNVANFRPLPRPMIEHYIRRGAIAYHRPGWILVDDVHYGRWLAMFKTAYDVRERKQFGTYSAYDLVPR